MNAALKALHNPTGKGPFTPASIAGLTMWYDASAITGQADNTSLSTWNDLSGNGYTMTQATSAAKPTYYSSTVGKTINGLPAVWFDGTDDYMSEVTSILLQPSSLFMAGYCTFNGGDIIAGGSTGALEWRFNGASSIHLISQYTADLGSSTSAPSITTPEVAGVTWSGTSIQFFLNSHTADPPVSASTTMSANTVVLGTNVEAGPAQYWAGPMGEVIVYNSVLTSANITKLVNYLGTKWGIAVT